MKREDNILTLAKLKFSMKGYSELKQEEISWLLETAFLFIFFIPLKALAKMRNKKWLLVFGCSKIQYKI